MAEARTEPRGLAMPFPAMLGAEPWTGSKSEVFRDGCWRWGGGRGGRELRAQVGDNVDEKVVGDDDVELAGIADEFHGEGIDV